MNRGRLNYGGQVVVTAVGAVAVELIGSNPHRRTLLITPSTTVSLTLSLDPAVAAGKGLVIPANGHPLELCYEDYGELLCQPWFIIASGADNIGHLAVYDLECGCP